MDHETLENEELNNGADSAPNSTNLNNPQNSSGEPVDGASESDTSDVENVITAAIETAQREIEDLRSQNLRVMADFQNFKKRIESEKALIRQLATERLLNDLLPVLDNFERSNRAIQNGASLESIREGLNAVERMFRSTLESNQVQRIATVGELFDPEVHEAVSFEETTEFPDDSVIEELEPGYRLPSRILRPAKVRIARRP